MTIWTVASQALLSMGFSRQESWSGVHFPPTGDLPDPGIEPNLLCVLLWQVDSLSLVPLGMPVVPSVQFGCSVVSYSLCPYGLQHTRLACPSPTPRAYSNSCPSRQWCHPTISSFVVPFSYCPQSFPASGSLWMSQFFPSGSQSFSFSVSPSNAYSGLISFRMDWLDPIEVQGTLKHLLQHHSLKASILRHSTFFFFFFFFHLFF